MKAKIFLGVILWLTLVGVGISYVAAYENTPGANDLSHPNVLPGESAIKADKQLQTLIFFAHPYCPCTRASLAELSRVLAGTSAHVRTTIVFIKPSTAPDDWEHTDLVARAREIQGATVLIDRDEREADLFGAQTSGLTLLYDVDGSLIFNGGITGSRGMEGDNTGRSSITDLILKNSSTQVETSVFGCPLFSNEECRHKAERNEQ